MHSNSNADGTHANDAKMKIVQRLAAITAVLLIAYFAMVAYISSDFARVPVSPIPDNLSRLARLGYVLKNWAVDHGENLPTSLNELTIGMPEHGRNDIQFRANARSHELVSMLYFGKSGNGILASWPTPIEIADKGLYRGILDREYRVQLVKETQFQQSQMEAKTSPSAGKTPSPVPNSAR